MHYIIVCSLFNPIINWFVTFWGMFIPSSLLFLLFKMILSKKKRSLQGSNYINQSKSHEIGNYQWIVERWTENNFEWKFYLKGILEYFKFGNCLWPWCGVPQEISNLQDIIHLWVVLCGVFQNLSITRILQASY